MNKLALVIKMINTIINVLLKKMNQQNIRHKPSKVLLESHDDDDVTLPHFTNASERDKGLFKVGGVDTA